MVIHNLSATLVPQWQPSNHYIIAVGRKTCTSILWQVPSNPLHLWPFGQWLHLAAHKSDALPEPLRFTQLWPVSVCHQLS